MIELWKYVLLFAVGIAAGFFNVMAGGGSALTLPALIFLGLDSALANGTNRIAILFQNISAVTSFRRHDVHEFKRSLSMALWAMPGAIAGAVAAVHVNDEVFQRVLAIIMIGTIITMFIPQSQSIEQDPDTIHKREKWIYPSMLAIGFYGGFIQVSVGFLIMAALFHILKLNLTYVNMHKVTVVLLYMIPALLVFSYTGNVDWFLGIVLGLGSAVGGWWAAHASVKGGDKVIRGALSLAILIMALKLFDVF